MSKTSPRKANSPRTVTRGTRMYPFFIRFSESFIESNSCPILSEKTFDFEYSGEGTGVIKERCGIKKIRGLSETVAIFAKTEAL